jgi:DNA-binding protein H-NS
VKVARSSRAGVAPKYRDPESGSTWSGRGKPPKWIAGQDRDSFLIGK